MLSGTLLHQIPELPGRLREEFPGSPVDDDAVLANQIHFGQFTSAVPSSNLLRIRIEPAHASGPNLIALGLRRSQVDLVCVGVSVDDVDDDAIVDSSPLNGYVLIDDVLENILGGAIERITVTATACAGRNGPG